MEEKRMNPKDKAEKLQELYRARTKVKCKIEEIRFRIEKMYGSIQEEEQKIRDIDELIFIVEAISTPKETATDPVS